MKIRIQKKYLDTALTLDLEGKDLKEALFNAALFTQRDVCGVCGNAEVALKGNKAQGYTFAKRQCMSKSCRATSNLSEYKDGGYFWNKWEVYQKTNQQSQPQGQQAPPPQSPPPEVDYDTDMPF